MICLRWICSILMVLTIAACHRGLPEEGSAQAELYKSRCGGCHRPFHPGTLTIAMWEYQIDRAEKSRMTTSGNPLSEQDHEQILAYLSRHALNSGEAAAQQ